MPSPPQVGYDPDLVAAAARQHDPGLPVATAGLLAREAWQHLRDVGEPDAPAVARRLLADHPEAGATPANVVARAAAEFCVAHGLPLR